MFKRSSFIFLEISSDKPEISIPDKYFLIEVALVIKSLNYQKILSQTGEEIIDIGTPVAGTPLRGVCGMGMYNFLINFS